MLEFALILPVIAVLLLGISELGRALYQHNTLNKAIGSGSRLLARTYNGLDDSCVTQAGWNVAEIRAKNVIVYGHIGGNSITLPNSPVITNTPVIDNLQSSHITIAVSGGASPCVITVSVAVPYQPIFTSLFSGGPGLLELSPFNLQASAQERYIGE